MATQNAINTGFPIEATHGGSGLASPTAHGILVAEGSSAFNPIVLTNGQLLIGSTGADPVAASLTAGTGVTITPGAGSITIAVTAMTGGGFTWVDQTTTSVTLTAGDAYIADNAALVTLTLPATAAIGDTFKVVGKGAGGWIVAQNASQLIHFGTAVTTTGTGGSLASSNQWDCITFTCVTTNNVFVVHSSIGNITYV